MYGSKRSRNGKDKRTTKKRRIVPYNRERAAMMKRPSMSSAKLLTCPTLMPDKYRCRLSFATSGVSVMTGPGTPIVIVATQTSPFGSSVQPQGWDQLTAMYLKWRPLAMSLRITTGILTTNAANAAVLVRGYWSPYITPLGSDLAVIQNRYTKTVPVTVNNGYQTLTTKSNLRNIWGMSEREWMDDDTTIADVTAQPEKITRYFIHFVVPTTSNAFNYQYDIIGDMDVEFSNPRILLDA